MWQPLGYLKMLQSLLTLGMMLSISGFSSLEASLRALLQMEEMKEQLVSPLDVDSMKADKSLLTDSCDSKGL